MEHHVGNNCYHGKEHEVAKEVRFILNIRT